MHHGLLISTFPEGMAAHLHSYNYQNVLILQRYVATWTHANNRISPILTNACKRAYPSCISAEMMSSKFPRVAVLNSGLDLELDWDEFSSRKPSAILRTSLATWISLILKAAVYFCHSHPSSILLDYYNRGPPPLPLSRTVKSPFSSRLALVVLQKCQPLQLSPPGTVMAESQRLSLSQIAFKPILQGNYCRSGRSASYNSSFIRSGSNNRLLFGNALFDWEGRIGLFLQFQ